MHGQNDAFFNLGKFKPTCMSKCISTNKDHTSLVYQCNNVHTKKNFDTLQEIIGPFSEISVIRRRKSHAFDSVKRLQYCSKVMQTLVYKICQNSLLFYKFLTTTKFWQHFYEFLRHIQFWQAWNFGEIFLEGIHATQN